MQLDAFASVYKIYLEKSEIDMNNLINIQKIKRSDLDMTQRVTIFIEFLDTYI